MLPNPARGAARDWDGTAPLSGLFDTEITPADPSEYFDQKFIDYLSANSDDLKSIHWRNFERLTAEFFRRLGYEVQLGPGSKDGGIDVRVWTDRQSTAGPPLIVIQCRRYGDGKYVQIETVKALYADVVNEDAQMGLIATTSVVAPGGKKIIRTRGYPLTVAESDAVKAFTYSMWRHAWQES